jgi:tetratricopeptide (TPR) repeat protein
VGDYQGAISAFEGAYEAALAIGSPFLQAAPLAALGSIYDEIGVTQLECANDFRERALGLLEMPMGVMAGSLTWAESGFSALNRGNIDQAETLFNLGISTPTPHRLITRSRFLLGLAQVALERGQRDESVRLAGEARKYSQERGMRHLLPEISTATGKILAAQGKLEEALLEYQQALDEAHSMYFRPLILRSAAGAADVLFELGRQAESASMRALISSVIEEIGGFFTDEGLKADYLQHARAKYLSVSS